MGQSMGMLDFFVLEAGEYLERLDALAQTPAGAFPNAEEFVRVARAWRGGALMASQQPMARAAQGLEAAGRALKDARLAWDERVRGEVIRAVDDCKTYLHRIRTPAPEDAARAEEMGAALERLAGRTSGSTRASGIGLDAGARAFVAREAAAIASALDHAAQGLAADRASRDALAGVAPAMSALRGVAVLNDLPPLGDLLAAVDGALKEVYATSGAVAPAVPGAFDWAAKAMARAAREVVDAGRPALDSAQAGEFATALLATFAGAGEIVPVEALFFGDAGPHVVREGAAPSPLSQVELVSQGEFLERAADELSRAGSAAVRDLRLFAIAAALRPLAGAGGAPVAVALGRMADAARGAIGARAAGTDVEFFSATIADAARALRTVRTGGEAPVVQQLEAAVERLGALSGAAPGARAAAPAPSPAPAAPPRKRTTRVVPALAEAPAAAVPPAAGDERDLAFGYASLERMIAERGLPLGSLEELLGAPAAAEEAGVVPGESLAPDEEGVVPIESLAPDADAVVPIETLAPDGEVVPIETLLYRGQTALRRALELRSDLAALARAPGNDAARLYELQREVFDLVELGLSA